MEENQQIEKKSLKIVQGKTADWAELSKDCVCFANARGGSIYIGIERDAELPPSQQKIEPELPHIIRKRISELTINVGLHTEKKAAENGGEFILIKVLPSASTIASTTDGRYYIRISDHCQPLPPDELQRLLTDKPAFIWETKTVKSVRRQDVDQDKLLRFIAELKESDRVLSFVKSKTPDEILDYYMMAEFEFLTNLGVLWVGKRKDRAKLLYAPVIQFLKYDEHDNRVNKLVWDDYSLNPVELLEAVWTQIPDWKEGIEISDGIFRKFIPNYEEIVIRELVANALVHRPYTTRGDIFINLYSDRLEIHNPGLLPIGITPSTILHKSVRRNEHLAKVFYDLKLMEREGSGYDKIYETLLSNGKQIPEPVEGDDRVTVTIRKRIAKTGVVSLINRINDEYQLRQKELICLGLIAQYTSLSAIEFSIVLALPQQNAIRDWIGRLMDLNIILSKGKTKGKEYFINPTLLQKVKFRGKTSLKTIENHRLKELIYQDVATYPKSSISEIWQRIGKEIPKRKIKFEIDKMLKNNEIMAFGEKRWRKYSINRPL